jgi:hypothetical protein
MSALPPKADILHCGRYVCFGPKADTARPRHEPLQVLPATGIAIRSIRIREVDTRTIRIPRSAPWIERWHSRDIGPRRCDTIVFHCRDPWAARLAPEIESSRAKASVRMWNLVSTAVAASIADSGMEYLTHQVRKRVGPWSNKRRVKIRFGSKADILACIGHVRFTPKSGHVRCN